jgi:tryptophan-rich sensory protein
MMRYGLAAVLALVPAAVAVMHGYQPTWSGAPWWLSPAWPLLLFLAAESLVRVWQRSRWLRAVLAAAAVGAAGMFWRDMVELLAFLGVPADVRSYGPGVAVALFALGGLVSGWIRPD